MYEIARRNFDLALSEERTLATITLLGIGLAVLITASRPLRLWKVGVAVLMAAGYGLILALPSAREYFELDMFSGAPLVMVGVAVLVSSLLIFAIPTLVPGLSHSGPSE